MSRRGEASTAASKDERWWRADAEKGPFRRLVVVHAVTGAAGAAFAVSLAGSLFFNVSVNAARPRILIYLLSTLAPFALVVPLLAPFTDRFRGGYRAVIVATAVGRSAVCALLANHLTTLFFFPEAFAVLVLGKTYTIAKSALVPRLVADQEKLVAANAQMERVGTVGGLLGGAVAALVLRLLGPPAVVIAAAAGQAVAAALAIRIPRPAPAPPNRVVEVAELTSAPLSLAASAMIVLRFAVGFITFLLALNLKTASEPAWVYGMVLVAGVVGGLSGTVIGPLLRRRVAEEEALLTASLAVSGALCVLAAAQDRRTSAVLISFAVGVAAAVAHQAFDSTTQRLAPDAEMGRAFARFETWFQLAWVAGAVGPVLARPSGFVGLLVVGFLLGFGALVYTVGRRSVRAARPVAEPGMSDPVEALVALANVLRLQGSPALAVLTAAEAVRVAGTRRPLGDDSLPAELAAVWLHVTQGGVPSDEDVGRAVQLAEEARDDGQGPTGPATPPS